jgi:hypothetical protein
MLEGSGFGVAEIRGLRIDTTDMARNQAARYVGNVLSD